MKIFLVSLMLMATIPATAIASGDCIVVEFPDNYEVVCTGDGVKLPETAKIPVEATATKKGTPETAANPEQLKPPQLKPEERVIVPKSLEIRMKRAEQTMERMRLQKQQRNPETAPSTTTPSPVM